MKCNFISRRHIYWLLTFLVVLTVIECCSRLLEYIENTVSRRKNPFVEPVNLVPAFKIVENMGVKVVVRSGFHPLMNPELRPFPLERPKGGLRVFVLGGSAAAGWPYHSGDTNISSLLERKLRMLQPGRSVEVINVAAGTYASHRVKFILEEVLHYNPDILVLYNGNNEFLEGLVYRSRTPTSPWDYSAAVRLAYRLTVPLPRIDVQNYDLSAQIPNTLAFAFSKASLYREDPHQFQMLLDHYRYNINEMVTLSHSAGVPLFLLTCPVNLKDWVPNVSRHRKGLAPVDRARWIELFREGFLAVERGDYFSAIFPLKAAIAIDDEYAETHFRLAQSLLHTGQRFAARDEFNSALQRDAFPFRELPEFQSVLREIASKRAVPLLDISESLASVAKDGIPGLDVFIDYVHLTEQSQEVVAQQILMALWEHGHLKGVSSTSINNAHIVIPKTFKVERDVAAADLNYNMAMVMHQYERLDALYEEAITTFIRAAKEDPSIADECRNRFLLFREIHPVVRAYRDLLRADKLGLREKTYTPAEAERVFSMYREMIRQVKTPSISRDEFSKNIPDYQFK